LNALLELIIVSAASCVVLPAAVNVYFVNSVTANFDVI